MTLNFKLRKLGFVPQRDTLSKKEHTHTHPSRVEPSTVCVIRDLVIACVGRLSVSSWFCVRRFICFVRVKVSIVHVLSLLTTKKSTFVSWGFLCPFLMLSFLHVCVCLTQLCVLSYKHVRSWFTPSRPRRDKALFSHDFATFSQTSVSPLNKPNNSFSQARAAVSSLVRGGTRSTGTHHKKKYNISYTQTWRRSGFCPISLRNYPLKVCGTSAPILLNSFVGFFLYSGCFSMEPTMI